MSYEGLLVNKMKVVTRTRGDYGSYSESVGSPVSCRIMFQNRLITDYKGMEVLSIAKIFCQKDTELSHKDKLQLDLEGYKLSHLIAMINKPQNSVGHHHTEVYIV